MIVRKYLLIICVLTGMVFNVRAGDNYEFSIPKIAFTYDFNSMFSNDNAYGPRLQIFSNSNYFGKYRDRTRRLGENTLVYTYGIGFGGYRVTSMEKAGSNNDLYHAYLMFTINYQNHGMFEPFVGVYPGLTWGSKTSYFVNPVTGINITAFRVRKNWNSLLFQSYFQTRIEYNTMLSTVFLGLGMIIQIM